MRLHFSLPLAFLALAGCASVTRVSGDNFQAASTAPEKFDNDNAACREEADSEITYDVRVMGGTHYALNRAFNASYTTCMKARGYRARSDLQNILPDFSLL